MRAPLQDSSDLDPDGIRPFLFPSFPLTTLGSLIRLWSRLACTCIFEEEEENAASSSISIKDGEREGGIVFSDQVCDAAGMKYITREEEDEDDDPTDRRRK